MAGLDQRGVHSPRHVVQHVVPQREADVEHQLGGRAVVVPRHEGVIEQDVLRYASAERELLDLAQELLQDLLVRENRLAVANIARHRERGGESVRGSVTDRLDDLRRPAGARHPERELQIEALLLRVLWEDHFREVARDI